MLGLPGESYFRAYESRVVEEEDSAGCMAALGDIKTTLCVRAEGRGRWGGKVRRSEIHGPSTRRGWGEELRRVIVWENDSEREREEGGGGGVRGG